MSEARIEAVILKQQDYRENDALITVLSKDYGKLGFVCRGIRKMASKNAVSCMPFVLSELMFDYKEQATLFSLKSARVLAAHRHIREDLEKMTIAQVMCEIADKLLEQGESDLEAAGELYELLSVSLDRLDSEADSYLILAQFTALALKTEGIEPVVDECVLCSNTQVQTISVEDGGFLCAECAAMVHARPMEVGALKRFRLINKAQLVHFAQLRPYGPWTKNDAELLVEFLMLHSGVKLESWRFLDRLAN